MSTVQSTQQPRPMTKITIPIPKDRLAQLQTMAAQLRVTPEELVQASITELLDHSEEAFEQTVDYLLNKNRELYQRLAQCDI